MVEGVNRADGLPIDPAQILRAVEGVTVEGNAVDGAVVEGNAVGGKASGP
jgi:hypothetical protein